MSHRTLFKTIAIAICIVVAAVWIVRSFAEVRREARRADCFNNMRQISLSFGNHISEHRAFPPAYVASEDGSPLLSWRVLLNQYIYYDVDFRKWMDFARPWDDPKNAEFLDGMGQLVFQCPETGLRTQDHNITSFVAVVGPGTLWEASQGGKKIESLKDATSQGSVDCPRLIVVEWPWSDIHWAEPRDITLDELLEYFQNLKSRKPNHRDFLHYIDSAFQVGELPLNTPVEVVREMVIRSGVSEKQ